MGTVHRWGKEGPQRCSHLPRVPELPRSGAWTYALPLAAPDVALVPHQLPSTLLAVQILGWALPSAACPAPGGRVVLACPWHRTGTELNSAHQQ